MFTGIIKHTGKVHRISKYNNNCILEINSKIKFIKSEIGSSILCSGACLTLKSFTGKLSKYYISKETLNRTNFKYCKTGDIINIEKSLKFGDRISGHFVQGHVDCTSVVSKLRYIGKSWFVTFNIKNRLKKYFVEKGSVSINGVSLTISKVLKNGFQTVIIPQTLKHTNLIKIKEGDVVNLEIDIFCKYIESISK